MSENYAAKLKWAWASHVCWIPNECGLNCYDWRRRRDRSQRRWRNELDKSNDKWYTLPLNQKSCKSWGGLCPAVGHKLSVTSSIDAVQIMKVEIIFKRVSFLNNNSQLNQHVTLTVSL